VTSLAPPAVRAPKTSPAAGGRGGSVVWMAVPAFVMFLAFGVVPLLGVIALSFSSWNGIGTIHWFTGAAGWQGQLTSGDLWHAVGVTFLIMVLSWLFQTPISILIGTFLAAQFRYRGVLAVLYFIPLLLSSAAISITFRALLDPNFGIGAGFGLDLLNQDWLGKSKLAIGVVIFILSWQFVPFHALIYQGGVRQIPQALYEAAEIDGAGRVRQFFSITLPQLKYTIITSSTLMVVGSLTLFDLIFVLTNGGPGDSTRTLALAMYQLGFSGSEMGPASVIAVILVLFGLIIAQVLRRLGGRADESQLEGA
jgi:raffinose/stachyose/melibiose transport system permease protein